MLPLCSLSLSGKPTYPALEDWIEIFRHSIGSFRRTAEADPSLPEAQRQAAAQQFASTYLALVNELERQQLAAPAGGSGDAADGAQSGTGGSGGAARRLGCLELCQLRCARLAWNAVFPLPALHTACRLKDGMRAA